jgi:hypothetical protein
MEGVISMGSEVTKDSAEGTKALIVQPYGDRYYALYEGEDLTCVTVYKKGGAGSKETFEMVFVQGDRCESIRCLSMRQIKDEYFR